MLLYIGAFAQNKPGTIRGTVLTTNNKPIPSVTVELLNQDSKALVKAGLTDKSGIYSFENIATGQYIISYTSTGYEKKLSAPFEITAEKDSIEIPAVQLAAQPKSLGNVTVVGNKPFIEQKLDKTIINVDASPSNAGSTAMEVLEKSPGITVDNDGTISLKGKQGVIIMMDGKQTYLSAADLATILRSMPASALDQIEIMTNPSSKYDAAGNSGIINIKTKKT